MLITDDFVLLNFPKTGSTFTRKIIRKVYGDKCKELLLPPAFNRHAADRKGQHGTYSQIPSEHRSKTILSVVRSPFDRYVSQYRFKWYSHSPPEKKEILSKIYPRFPEIGFSEFLDMTDRFSKKNLLTWYNACADTNIGFQTLQFLAFYSGDPESDLGRLMRGEASPFETLPRIRFLHQESLRDELSEFLLKLTGDKSITEMVKCEKDENVSRLLHEKDFRQFWTSELLDAYSEKERFLLDVFPEYRWEK